MGSFWVWRNWLHFLNFTYPIFPEMTLRVVVDVYLLALPEPRIEITVSKLILKQSICLHLTSFARHQSHSFLPTRMSMSKMVWPTDSSKINSLRSLTPVVALQIALIGSFWVWRNWLHFSQFHISYFPQNNTAYCGRRFNARIARTTDGNQRV